MEEAHNNVEMKRDQQEEGRRREPYIICSANIIRLLLYTMGVHSSTDFGRRGMSLL